MNLIKIIYNNSPIFFQNLLVSFEGNKRKKIRFNNKESIKYVELANSSDLNKKEFRIKRLNEYLKNAYKNSEFWKEKLDKVDYSLEKKYDLDFLKKIDIISKSDLQENNKKIINKKMNKKKLISACTSGTSGAGLNFYYTKEAVAANFTLYWEELFHQNKIGDKYGTFNGNLIVPREQVNSPYWRFNKAFNQTLFSAFHMNQNNLEYYYKELKSGDYKFINGYPSAIFEMAEYILRNKLEPICINAVYTSSETLLDKQRTVIEKAFLCKVYDYYSNAELSISCYQDVNGEYKVSEIFSFVWFKETNRCVEGEKAYKVIGTSFLNEAFYIINYDTNDLVLLDKNGNIKKIIGREEDCIITKDGRKIGRLDHLFKNADDVKEAQIIQKNLKNITIKLVLNSRTFKSKAKILNEIKIRIGKGMQVKFEIVEAIEKTKNGKLKFVISELKEG